MIDQSKFRLVPLEGVGRVGIQPKFYSLGTSDSEADIIVPGYLDSFIDDDTVLDSRLLFDGDLINVRFGIGGSSPAWGSFKVSHDEVNDSYTLIPVDLAPGSDTTSFITAQMPITMGAPPAGGGQVFAFRFPQATKLHSAKIVSYKAIVGDITFSFGANGGVIYATGSFTGPLAANASITIDQKDTAYGAGDFVEFVVQNTETEDTKLLLSFFYT